MKTVCKSCCIVELKHRDLLSPWRVIIHLHLLDADTAHDDPCESRLLSANIRFATLDHDSFDDDVVARARQVLVVGMINFALQRPPRFPRKPTGGRAPSINIGAGHSALERLLEILSSVCGGRPDPTGACRPVVMGHDRLVSDFRVVYLDSIDERLPEDL